MEYKHRQALNLKLLSFKCIKWGFILLHNFFRLPSSEVNGELPSYLMTSSSINIQGLRKDFLFKKDKIYESILIQSQIVPRNRSIHICHVKFTWNHGSQHTVSYQMTCVIACFCFSLTLDGLLTFTSFVWKRWSWPKFIPTALSLISTGKLLLLPSGVWYNQVALLAAKHGENIHLMRKKEAPNQVLRVPLSTHSIIPHCQMLSSQVLSCSSKHS